MTSSCCIMFRNLICFHSRLLIQFLENTEYTVIFSLAISYLQRYVKNVFKNLLFKKSELLSDIYMFTEICKLDLQLPVQSVPITTKIVSLNPSHGDVYSIQLLCDKVC